MSHVIIILDQKADCIVTKTNQLKGYAHDLDDILQNQLPSNTEDIHELLERVQTFFTMACEGSPPLSSDDTLDGLVGEAETLLEI